MQNFDQTHCNVIIGMQDFDQNPFQPTSIPYRRHHCKDMWILICNFTIFLFLFEAMQEKQQNLKTAERTFYSSSTIKRGASTPALQRPCSSQLPPDRPAAAKLAAKRPCPAAAAAACKMVAEVWRPQHRHHHFSSAAIRPHDTAALQITTSRESQDQISNPKDPALFLTSFLLIFNSWVRSTSGMTKGEIPHHLAHPYHHPSSPSHRLQPVTTPPNQQGWPRAELPLPQPPPLPASQEHTLFSTSLSSYLRLISPHQHTRCCCLRTRDLRIHRSKTSCAKKMQKIVHQKK